MESCLTNASIAALYCVPTNYANFSEFIKLVCKSVTVNEEKTTSIHRTKYLLMREFIYSKQTKSTHYQKQNAILKFQDHLKI